MVKQFVSIPCHLAQAVNIGTSGIKVPARWPQAPLNHDAKFLLDKPYTAFPPPKGSGPIDTHPLLGLPASASGEFAPLEEDRQRLPVSTPISVTRRQEERALIQRQGSALLAISQETYLD